MMEYKALSDEELLELLKRVDHSAFNEIYNRYNGLLYVFARKITQDSGEAEDLVQEIFISLWDKRKTIQLKTSLSNYLYTAVRYKFFDLVAHRKVRTDFASKFQIFLEKEANPVEQYINEKQLSEAVEREVSNLPDKMREIFLLSRKAGLSHKEIAEKLELSEKTVKNQVNNSLKILRGKLGTVVFLLMLFHR